MGADGPDRPVVPHHPPGLDAGLPGKAPEEVHRLFVREPGVLQHPRADTANQGLVSLNVVFDLVIINKSFSTFFYNDFIICKSGSKKFGLYICKMFGDLDDVSSIIAAGGKKLELIFC